MIVFKYVCATVIAVVMLLGGTSECKVGGGDGRKRVRYTHPFCIVYTDGGKRYVRFSVSGNGYKANRKIRIEVRVSGWGEQDVIKTDTRTSDRFGSWESQPWTERMPEEGDIYMAVQTWESGKSAGERTSTGFSSDSRSTEVTFTMEPDVAGPLMAMSLAFGALRVALVDSEQEPHWDLNSAVVRVAPSAKAAKIYRGRDSMALPHNYTGPMPDSDAKMPGYPDEPLE